MERRPTQRTQGGCTAGICKRAKAPYPRHRAPGSGLGGVCKPLRRPGIGVRWLSMFLDTEERAHSGDTKKKKIKKGKNTKTRKQAETQGAGPAWITPMRVLICDVSDAGHHVSVTRPVRRPPACLRPSPVLPRIQSRPRDVQPQHPHHHHFLRGRREHAEKRCVGWCVGWCVG